MAMLGLIAGALLCASGVAVLLGVVQQGGAVRTIATMPEFFWELLLGIYLTVRGFRSSAVASQSARTSTQELAAAV
jgi:Na+/H+ antiporter NhaC